MDDPFDLDAPRQCPYCHEAVFLRVSKVPGPPPSGTTTTIEPQHGEPVCREWKAIGFRRDLMMHLLYGTALPVTHGRPSFSRPVIIALVASIVSLFLAT